MNQPPWPTNYGRHDYRPSIFMQAEPSPQPVSDVIQDACQKQARERNRHHIGPIVKLDTSRIKVMREAGRSWRSIAMAMGCSMGTVIARMQDDYPEFMRTHRGKPPAGARCVQRKAKAGS